jgi:ribosome-associated heat shock protein Hsp15
LKQHRRTTAETCAEGSRQRLDRWLWHARLVKTRSLAASLAASGYVRLNGRRIEAPARAVRPGDVLTIALPNTVKVLRIVNFAERRGDLAAARRLYEEIEPAKSSPTATDLLAKRKSVR